MSSIKITEKIIIDESPEKVFDFTQDYKKRLIWDRFLKKADLIEGAKVADKDVKAYCVAKNGLGMVTQYVTYNRPKVTAVKMTSKSFVFNSFLGSWTFNEIAKEKTEVIFLYSFTLSFPFNLLTKFIKNNLQNNVKQRLVDLKSNIEKKSTRA